MRNEARSTRFVRALVVAAGALLPACASSIAPDSGAPTDANEVTTTDVVQPTDVRAACECCPTGDWSGSCVMNPMLFDASHAPTPPPDGSRWCNSTESQQNSCAIAGPMLPPELAV